MYIQRTATYTMPRFNDPADYRQELKRYTDFYLRRSNKFIMLALLGSHACMHGAEFPDDMPVYFATENGNLYDTEVVLNQIYRNKSFPKPINFINTMSNVAAFYVAQSLNISGRNIMVSSKSFSFERALELLKAEFLAGSAQYGLVGSVDEAVFSDEVFEKKFNTPTGLHKLVEATSWFYVSCDNDHAAAKIELIRSFKNMEQASSWIREQPFDQGTVYATGILIDDEEKSAWRDIFSGTDEYDIISDLGYNDSITAAGIARFVQEGVEKRLIAVNRDQQGHYAVTVVSK